MALLSFSVTRCDEMNGSICTTSIWLSRMVLISASTIGNGNHRAVAGLGGDDDLAVTAAVDKQPALDLQRRDAVMQAGGSDPALEFVLRVLAVPEPDPSAASA